eukprot:535529-Pleurochrysis_carterae.AAC.3
MGEALTQGASVPEGSARKSLAGGCRYHFPAWPGGGGLRRRSYICTHATHAHSAHWVAVSTHYALKLGYQPNCCQRVTALNLVQRQPSTLLDPALAAIVDVRSYQLQHHDFWASRLRMAHIHVTYLCTTKQSEWGFCLNITLNH